MSRKFSIFCPSNTTREQDVRHVRAVRASLALAYKALRDNPPPTTFTGNQTWEPFPSELDADLAPHAVEVRRP